MDIRITAGILIPFIGTSLGAAMTFFMRKQMSSKLQRCLSGFAAGVMTAASVWSLLIPSIQQSSSKGRLSFVPAAVGFWIGIFFLMILDYTVPHMHTTDDEPEGVKSKFQKTTMLILAVTMHNIPEGMAVGVVFAGWHSGNSGISVMAAVSLALGIAIQNFPEGAIVSMPLQSEGMSKYKAFMMGILSGAVEPIAAVITILAASAVVPILPYLLSFAAGAMLYVVVEELIPEMSAGKHTNLAPLAFTFGFTVMMVLDNVLG